MINITLRAGGLTLFLFLLGSDFVLGWLNNIKSSTQQSERSITSSSDQSCFCHLTGVLDDCFCDIESIDVFNNFKIYPKIQKLTERDFFRYYKVNLRRPCPFWPDDGHCSIKNCQVEPCPESKVPMGIKAGNYNKEYCLMGDRGLQSKRTGNQKPDAAPKGETDTEEPGHHNAHCASSFNGKDSAMYSQAANTVKQIEDCVQANQLGAINSTLSNQSKEAFVEWARHDDAKDHFCELDDETSPDAEYVDLLFNPERYTGYKGPSAWRVWNSIYEENCFKPRSVYRPLNPLAPSRGDDDGENFYNWLEGLCLEKRVFYRLISGLHTSINIHLCAKYLIDEGWGKTTWGTNVKEFRHRFDPVETKGEGTRRLKNLYFLYLIELRALSKVAPYFERTIVELYTGNTEEDAATKELLLQVFNETKAFPMHFDEKSMFAGGKKRSKNIKGRVQAPF